MLMSFKSTCKFLQSIGESAAVFGQQYFWKYFMPGKFGEFNTFDVNGWENPKIKFTKCMNYSKIQLTAITLYAYF